MAGGVSAGVGDGWRGVVRWIKLADSGLPAKPLHHQRPAPLDPTNKLTVQNSTQLVQVAMDARELGRDLVDRVHKVLDDEDVVLLRVRRRRGRHDGR